MAVLQLDIHTYGSVVLYVIELNRRLFSSLIASTILPYCIVVSVTLIVTADTTSS